MAAHRHHSFLLLLLLQLLGKSLQLRCSPLQLLHVLRACRSSVDPLGAPLLRGQSACMNTSQLVIEHMNGAL